MMNQQIIDAYSQMHPELPVVSYQALPDTDEDIKKFQEDAEESLKAYDKTYLMARIATDKLAKDRYLSLDNETTLPNIARDARDGRSIQLNHSTYGDNGIPMGKTITGQHNRAKGEVVSKFYIDQDERGTHIARKVLGGTITDGSPGLATGGSFIECSECKGEIKYGWFSYGCKNGHYPGKKIYLDRNGKETTELDKAQSSRVATGLWKNAGLREFSLVYKGALPDVKILKQAFSEGLLTQGQIDYLSHTYGSNFMEQLSTREYSIPTGGPRMSNPTDEQVVLQELRDTNATLTGEKAALETQVSEMQAKADAYDENLQNLTEAQAEVTRLEGELNAEQAKTQELQSLQEKADKVDRCIAIFQDIVIRERRRAKGVGESQEARDAAEQRIKNMQSADALNEMLIDFQGNVEQRYTPKKSVVTDKKERPASDVDKSYLEAAY